MFPSPKAAIEEGRQRMKKRYDRHASDRAFKNGDPVLVHKWTTAGKRAWVPAVVVRPHSSTQYIVRIQDKEEMRHANQIRPRSWTDSTDVVAGGEEAADAKNDVLLVASHRRKRRPQNRPARVRPERCAYPPETTAAPIVYYYYRLPQSPTIDTAESEEDSTSSQSTPSAADESGTLDETSESFYSTGTSSGRTAGDSVVTENNEEADATPNVSPTTSGPSLTHPRSPVPLTPETPPPRRSARPRLPKSHFSPAD
jgi:hypothetical protein